MHRVSLLVAGLLALTGCATQPEAPRLVEDRPAAAPVDVGIDWGWRVIGDAAVRPSQVFSLNGMTYVQMPPGKPDVVLIADGVVANYKLYPPYLVIAGVPTRVDVLNDGFRAVVTRMVAPEPHRERVTRPAANGAEAPAGTPSRITRVAE